MRVISFLIGGISVALLSNYFGLLPYAPAVAEAQSGLQLNVATTSVTVPGLCGNGIVEAGQDCDRPGELGEYSTTIEGRQCRPDCTWGPYCGDGILQPEFGEECDDGTNTDEGFCSADCRIIPSGSDEDDAGDVDGGPTGGGSTGGGSSGGGSSGGAPSGGGGSSVDLGATQVRVVGRGYPNTTINFILDTEDVGSIRSDSDGRFEFRTGTNPGTASLGVWAEDRDGTRSIAFNTTFDVTQASVTSVEGVILPPTLRVSAQEVDPGEVVTVSGQSIPRANIELHTTESGLISTTVAGADGSWSIELDTATLSIREHTLRARSLFGTGSLLNTSGFSRSVQLFVGVDGQAVNPADLNRDGRVNLVDFSILIFWWGTDGGNSDPPADINQDGRVNLADFSILLFNWTG